MITRTNSAVTLDAVPVALFAFQPLLDDTVYKYKGEVAAISAATGNTATYDISFSIKRVGGIATFVAAAAPIVVAIEDDPAWDVTIAIVGTDQVVVSVVGDGTPNVVNWYGELSSIQLSV
jgi:hypothetical protein